MSYKGWIEINWDKIEYDFKEGVENDDEKSIIQQAGKILTYKIPKMASFTAGFYYGWGFTSPKKDD